MDGKELFLMIEAISNEKNISKENVIESLEEALAVATKKRNNLDFRVEVDRHSGKCTEIRKDVLNSLEKWEQEELKDFKSKRLSGLS